MATVYFFVSRQRLKLFFSDHRKARCNRQWPSPQTTPSRWASLTTSHAARRLARGHPPCRAARPPLPPASAWQVPNAPTNSGRHLCGIPTAAVLLWARYLTPQLSKSSPRRLTLKPYLGMRKSSHRHLMAPPRILTEIENIRKKKITR